MEFNSFFVPHSAESLTIESAAILLLMAAVRTYRSFLRQRGLIEPRRTKEAWLEEWQNAFSRLWWTHRYVRLRRPPDPPSQRRSVVDVRDEDRPHLQPLDPTAVVWKKEVG